MTRHSFLSLFQSRISVSQLRRGSQDPDQILAVDVRGQFYPLKLGPGIQIINGEIRATRPPAIRLTPDTSGSYDLQGRNILSRNGLIQFPGADYRIEADRAIPLTPWDVDDLVLGL